MALRSSGRWSTPYWKKITLEKKTRMQRRDPKWFETSLDDLTHFLAERLRDDDDEPIPYQTLRKLYKVVFDLMTDVLVEGGNIEIPHLGTFVIWHKHSNIEYRTLYLRTHKDMMKRLNDTEEHLTLKTESVLEAINIEREKRLAKNDKQIEAQRSYRERLKQKNDKDKEDEA